MIWNQSEFIVFLLSVSVFMIAIEVGFLLGRHNAKSTRNINEMLLHAVSIQTAILGLLALLLGFTFSMSVNRFDMRKNLVVEEASEMSTLYLRAQLLAPEYEGRITPLLKSYVQTRLDYYDAGIDQEKIRKSNKESSLLAKQLWDIAKESAKNSQSLILDSLFIENLNRVIDLAEERQAALDNHVPETVIFLLLLVAAVGISFISYCYGLRENTRYHISTAVFAMLMAIVLLVILDIDRPRRGFVTISQEPLSRVLDEMN